MVQVHAVATLWRFESSPGHQTLSPQLSSWGFFTSCYLILKYKTMRLYVCPEANTEVRVLVVSEWYRQQLKKLTHE